MQIFNFSKFFEVFRSVSKIFEVSFKKFFKVFESCWEFVEVFQSFWKFSKFFKVFGSFSKALEKFSKLEGGELSGPHFYVKIRIFSTKSKILNRGTVASFPRLRVLSLREAPDAASAMYVRFRVWASPNPHVTCLCRSQARPVSDRARAAARL